MSTKQSISHGDDYHLYTDVMDVEKGDERPVYLSIKGLNFSADLDGDYRCVTVKLTMKMARELGLVK